MKNGFNRREFLQTISGTVTALALGRDSEISRISMDQRRKVVYAASTLRNGTKAAPRTSESAVQYTERLLREFEELEERTFKPAIPEWERMGDRMLMIMTFETLDVTEKLVALYKPFINGIPQETTLHVVTTSENDQFVRNRIQSLNPDIKLITHPLPIRGRDGATYAQDIAFSTGTADQNGAAHVLASTAERLLLLPGEDIDPEDMRWYGTQSDLDNKLAKFFPETFKAIKVPVNCNDGGDIEISRLPDGRRVLFLGTYGIVDQAIFMAAGMLKMDGSYTNGLFKKVLDKITAAYKKVTGVDEVIVIDEEKLVTWGEGVLQRKVKGPYDRSTFFHIDMVFKTCTAADGTPIAFFTKPTKDTQIVTPDHAAYLDRVKKQLEDLGYEIVELPCGSYPARNYINMLMFRGQKDELTTVMLPQYGSGSTDIAARRIVEEQGFLVKPVDMSRFFDTVEDQENIGSLHCLVEVLT